MTRSKTALSTFTFATPRSFEDGASRTDLGKAECLKIAILHAFPLPATGTFSDLLSAIDAAEG